MKGWSLALRSVRRNRSRSLATGTAVALGFVGLTVLTGYVRRAMHFYRVSAIYAHHHGVVSIYKKDGLRYGLIKPAQYSLTAAEQSAIRDELAGDSRISMTAGYLDGYGLASNGCQSYPILISGIDPAAEARIRAIPEVETHVGRIIALRAGRPFWGSLGESLWAAGGPAPILVTRRLARLLRKPELLPEPRPRDASTIPITLDCKSPEVGRQIAEDPSVQVLVNSFRNEFSGADTRVTGHFTTGATATEAMGLLAPLALAQQVFETSDVTYMAAYPASGFDLKSASAFSAEITRRLRARGLQVDAYSFDDRRLDPEYASSFSFLGILAGLFGALVATVIGLSVMNSLALTIHERAREIGTLLALGFQPRQIAALFVKETVVLCVLSLSLGAAAGALVIRAVERANLRLDIPNSTDYLILRLDPGILWPTLISLALMACAIAAAAWALRGRLGCGITELLHGGSDGVDR